MPDSPRIEELKRRVRSDPASIAFAALAEEYRRTGRYEEAIALCRTGLGRHPSYISAHVTLGRALIEVGQYDAAREELEYVLQVAPENLAAIRGLADIQQRQGQTSAANELSATAIAEMEAALAPMARRAAPAPQPITPPANITAPKLKPTSKPPTSTTPQIIPAPEAVAPREVIPTREVPPAEIVQASGVIAGPEVIPPEVIAAPEVAPPRDVNPAPEVIPAPEGIRPSGVIVAPTEVSAPVDATPPPKLVAALDVRPAEAIAIPEPTPTEEIARHEALARPPDHEPTRPSFAFPTPSSAAPTVYAAPTPAYEPPPPAHVTVPPVFVPAATHAAAPGPDPVVEGLEAFLHAIVRARQAADLRVS